MRHERPELRAPSEPRQVHDDVPVEFRRDALRLVPLCRNCIEQLAFAEVVDGGFFEVDGAINRSRELSEQRYVRRQPVVFVGASFEHREVDLRTRKRLHQVPRGPHVVHTIDAEESHDLVRVGREQHAGVILGLQPLHPVDEPVPVQRDPDAHAEKTEAHVGEHLGDHRWVGRADEIDLDDHAAELDPERHDVAVLRRLERRKGAHADMHVRPVDDDIDVSKRLLVVKRPRYSHRDPVQTFQDASYLAAHGGVLITVHPLRRTDRVAAHISPPALLQHKSDLPPYVACQKLDQQP